MSTLAELRRKSLGRQKPRGENATTSRFVAVDFESSNAEIPSDTGLALVTWRTFRVTPLRNFSYGRQKLNYYSKHLNVYIEKELKKNCGILVSQDTTYTAKFSVLHGVATSEDDDETIKIEVFSKDKTELVAILASVEREQESWEGKMDPGKFTFLPLLLIKGKVKITDWVVGFLKDFFDCVIYPLTFTHVQMMWMGAMWAGSKPSSSPKPLFLEYTTGIEELSSIEYSIDAETISKVWGSIHDPKSNEMTENEVNRFHEAIVEHFRKIFSIDLSYFHLQTIGTTAAAIRRNGSIKIMCNGAVLFVLRHLTALSQELTLT